MRFCLFLISSSLWAQSWILLQQPWANFVAPTRAIDWRTRGVLGGIPNGLSQCGATVLAFGTAGTPAAPTPIQTAINACTANHFVQLGAGDFYLSSGFRIKGLPGVSIRGLGPDQTKLHFFAGDADCGIPFSANICIENTTEQGYIVPDNTANWTNGYTQGAMTITLDSKTNLSVGTLLLLDQIDDSSASDPGTIWVCAVEGICSTEGIAGTQRGNWPNTRGEGQSVVVTSISAGACPCTVGISSPLYMPNWRATQNPGAWWPTDTTSFNGVENLTIDGTNSVNVNNLVFFNARDGWVRNVTLLKSGRANIWMFQSTRITVESIYMFGSQTTGSVSYGIETDMTSDCLVHNSIFQQVTVAMVTGEQSTGCVYGYNFQIHDVYSMPVTWMDAANYHHSLANNYTLFEGNYVSGFTTDSIHGGSNFMMGFRNYWRGLDTGKNRETDAIQITSFNRFFNVYGNVLGTPSFHTTYECAAPAPSTATCAAGIDLSIYILGWSDHALRFNNTTNPGVNMSADAVNSTYTLLGGTQSWDMTAPVNYAFTPGAVVTFAGFTNTGNNAQRTLTNYTTGPACGTGFDCIATVQSNTGMVTESNKPGVTFNWQINNDLLVKSTLARYLNYDTVNASIQHNSAEIPSGITTFPTFVPGSFKLPTSLYLTKAPYWWQVKGQPSIPWPPIGPDVWTGTLANVGGHVNQIPAMMCYLNIMGGPADGSGSALTFNANNCYGPPAQPFVQAMGPQRKSHRVPTTLLAAAAGNVSAATTATSVTIVK